MWQNRSALLEVSTAHLSSASMSWLSYVARNHHFGVSEMATGFFMKSTDRPGSFYPGDVAALISLAQELGAVHLMFDRDAAALKGLPVYQGNQMTSRGFFKKEDMIFEIISFKEDQSWGEISVPQRGMLTKRFRAAYAHYLGDDSPFDLKDGKEYIFNFRDVEVEISGTADELRVMVSKSGIGRPINGVIVPLPAADPLSLAAE